MKQIVDRRPRTDAEHSLLERLRKRVVNIRAIGALFNVGVVTPGTWPRPKADPAKAARQPARRSIARHLSKNNQFGKIGKAFLKRWGSTDPTKRRRGRLASAGYPTPHHHSLWRVA